MFSLIMATKNRVEQIERFMQALVEQDYQNFELIIVDQNQDDRLVRLIKQYADKFTIKHVSHFATGISCSRNEGHKYIAAEANLVAFPDDDCVYPPGFLSKAAAFFAREPDHDILTTRILALDSDKDAFGFGVHKTGVVSEYTAWVVGVSPGIFLRRTIVDAVSFDESMGLGAPQKSSEDADFLLRCYDHGASIYHDANLFVRHPEPAKLYSIKQMMQREFNYGIGYGYLRIKRRIPWWVILLDLMIPIFLSLQSLFKLQFKHAIIFPSMVFGRPIGFWHGLKRFGFFCIGRLPSTNILIKEVKR